MRIWVSTVFILISFTTEIARSVRGPKLQGPLQKLQWRSRTSCRKFWWWCWTWPPYGSRHIRAKQKLLRKHKEACQKFLEPNRKPKVIYTDNSLEFGKACEDLSWNHCTSTPHRSETNGIAERAVRRVKECTSAVLLQSGLNENWWADSMECYTYLRNVTDLWTDGKTPYERRCGQPFKRTDYSILFIGWVSPYTFEGPVKNPSIWQESLTWIVPRISIVHGVNLEGWRTGCRPWGVRDDGRIEIYSKRLNAKEVIFPKKRRILLSSRRWTNQTRWRRSRPENIHLDTAATNSRRKSPWFSWRLRRVSSTTSRLVSGCRWSGGRLLVHVRKLQKQPSRWTPSQTLLAERRIIPYSTEIHRRRQNYENELGCYARETHRRLLEHWWIKRFVRKMDRFHTIYSIGRKSSRRIYVVRVKINEETAYIQARSSMARTLEINGKACQAEGEAKMVKWKLHLDKTRKFRGIYWIDPEGKEFKETIKNARKELETSVAPAMPCKIMKKNCGGGASKKN